MILIKVTKETKRFIQKCLKYKINLLKINDKKDYLLVKIMESDLEEIVRLNYYSEIEIIKYYGIKGVLLNIKKYFFDYLMLLLVIISLYFISNIIVSVEISHESKELRDYVSEILKNKKIVPLTYAKPISDLTSITDEILVENKDKLDWMSINRVGMKYVVSFEERIINNIKNKTGTCHIIATKDNIVRKIIADKGVSLVEIGSFVRKGDILISGAIMLNDKVKDNICAEGEVFGETWYKVTIKVPLKYEEKIYTENSRYNFSLNDNYLYKKNYKHFDNIPILNFSLLGTDFGIFKQQEVNYKTKVRTKNEATAVALEESKKKLLEKIGPKSQILEQNVLKETINNSTIELEIFIVAEEIVGTVEEYEVGELIDSK